MQRSEAMKKIETGPRLHVRISDLASRIRRLGPDHRDPHRFHEEKSEIAHEMNKLAKELTNG